MFRGAPFRDRVHAGQILADSLQPWRERNPLILGIPRGGVIVAAAIADSWGVTSDVVVARKIGTPGEPELALGAVTAAGHVILDRRMIAHFGVDEYQLTALIDREQSEARRREQSYRGNRPPPVIEDRVTIVVDDGAATGATMAVALKLVRTMSPAELIAAVPVTSSSARRTLEEASDQVVSAINPEALMAVGAYYQDFGEVSDETVIRTLAGANRVPGEQ
jgi:putative phosphoribosyl transferase